VQYSVFECVLDPKDFSRLRAAMQRIIHQDDQVSYYRLCEHCEQQIVTLGEVVTQPAHTLVV
jgi:CRISPR-associated protein Cas2